MKVAIIGNGGREHALGYAIGKSPLCSRLFFLPGNGGTHTLGENVDIDLKDHNQVFSFVVIEQIDFVVIGPEIPIVDGLGDFLRNHGIVVFAPTAEAARIESEKSYSKRIMKKYGIPTAAYQKFTVDEYDTAVEYLFTGKFPVVLKADGLAAGKGVVIASNFTEAENALRDMMLNKVFGAAGSSVVIEEFMEGEEASIFAITDGENFVCLPAAQDHKRAGDGDTGPNTGGMGAYCPARVVTSEIERRVNSEIIVPFLAGLRAESNPFTGCLYVGIMITESGPKVVEFNCRFGDPETQAVLPVLEGDLLSLLYSAANGEIDSSKVWYENAAAVSVVAASQGYPGKYEKGFEIHGLNSVKGNSFVFHAGTEFKENKTLTTGGRVLAVTSVDSNGNLRSAIESAYTEIKKISFDNIYYRKDIGHKAL
ncbi:MAG: phosphoribosylamine--glycine ligase [Ignavibacteria bacterium]|nr:phosphoribosylamine--glycine ligase [Ignavibacteria bacterium]